MNKTQKTLLAVSICLALSAQAEQTTPTKNENQLAEIVVYANQNSRISSSQAVSSEDIKQQPVSNGNISDYLKANPHVRFEHSDESSFQRGEIKPVAVSINGAESNQTSYFVDNVNANNDLGADLFDGSMLSLPVANSPQAYFFDANLLSSVTVYDSDISASLGGFTGGAVVAKTKQYDGKDGVQLRYRTSRSQWAKFHLSDEDRAKFEQATPNGSDADYQPKYDKQFFSVSAQKALTDNLGMVVGLSQRSAHIQQQRLINPQGDTDKQDHIRRSTNALLNFNWTPNDQNRVELGLRYSNYRESKFYATNIDSDVRDYHQAYGGTLAWVKSLDNGVLTTTLAYDQFKDKRKSASTQMKTYIVDGDEYFTGGMGNSDLTQDNLHASMEYALDAFNLGTTEHSISLGGIYQFTKYRFNRDQDATGEIYNQDYFDDDGDGDYDELVLGSSNQVHKGKVKASYQNIAVYLEDLISWKNLEFRPGVRLERDNYLKNTNFAPRFVATWKPFEQTKLSAGWNRYYGRSFASMKLTQAIYKLEGYDDSRFTYNDLSSFKTPHTDELSLGLQQQWANVIFDAKYIHRKNKDRIVLHDDGSERYFAKGQDYSNDVYTLQIKNAEPWKWGVTEWKTALAFDWLDMKGVNTGNYDGSSLVYLDGKLMTRDAMRAKINSNREEWEVRLGLDMAVPDYNVVWSNNLYVKAPIKGASENDDEINGLPAFRSYNYGTHTQWDSSIRWQPKVFNNHSVFVKFDVLNVLNKTRRGITSSGEDYGFYSAGREYWLELGYEF
ncbi:TonB-dependent receptor plug domain-containing protein [Lonepinella sp. BR2474]|uniref:TonB-dependent receptor plug domain-containing protein n=1 Tax=Lonepinella sp. BR2474 TaxID=3434548 RepID=UPI003F6DEC53